MEICEGHQWKTDHRIYVPFTFLQLSEKFIIVSVSFCRSDIITIYNTWDKISIIDVLYRGSCKTNFTDQVVRLRSRSYDDFCFLIKCHLQIMHFQLFKLIWFEMVYRDRFLRKASQQSVDRSLNRYKSDMCTVYIVSHSFANIQSFVTSLCTTNCCLYQFKAEFDRSERKITLLYSYYYSDDEIWWCDTQRLRRTMRRSNRRKIICQKRKKSFAKTVNVYKRCQSAKYIVYSIFGEIA